MNQFSENPYESPVADGETFAPKPSRTDLAPRMSRLGAAILDSIISIAVTLPLMFLFGTWERAMENQISLAENAILLLGGIVLFLLLHGYLLATRGQTIGKMAVQVKIVDYDTGELLPFGKLIGLRVAPIWIVSQIPVIGGFLALIDILFIFGEERRCVHDLIAGTKVVNA